MRPEGTFIETSVGTEINGNRILLHFPHHDITQAIREFEHNNIQKPDYLVVKMPKGCTLYGLPIWWEDEGNE